MGVQIKGLGSGVPERVVTNFELETWGDTNDTWIRERTGIVQRRIVTEETGLSLAFEAAQKAIEHAGITSADIDLIIVATVAPDMLVPSEAALLRQKLGAEKAVAFDVNAACSGFLYGTWVAKSLIETNNYKNALVVGVEVLSKITDWTDRGTFVLFGDGAGAAVLQNSEDKGILACHVENYTDETNALYCHGVGIENPLSETKGFRQKLFMDGRQVFRFATNAMVDSIKTVLEKAGKSIDDVTWFVPHQANKRIIDHAAAKLKVPLDRFVCNIDLYGNTSSASVPIAFAQLKDEKELKKGDIILLVAFGGGLTTAAILLEW